MSLSFLISSAVGVGANVTTARTSAVFQKVVGSRPDLENRLAQPSSPADLELALAEIGCVLEALAGSGSTAIDGALISALRSARFDHQDGRIHIGNATVSAPVLQTGGTGAGRTVIGGNTELRSAGMSIKVGQGAGIVIISDDSVDFGGLFCEGPGPRDTPGRESIFATSPADASGAVGEDRIEVVYGSLGSVFEKKVAWYLFSGHFEFRTSTRLGIADEALDVAGHRGEDHLKLCPGWLSVSGSSRAVCAGQF